MKHILILEDDFTYRKMLAQKLAPYGRIFEADCLEAALPILNLGHLDFALVDLDLEEKLDGLKFLREADGVECIVLSSHEEEEIIEKAYQLGAVEFFNKWNFDKYLKESLEDHLLNKRAFNSDDYYKTSNSELSKKIEEIISLFNKTDMPLLIQGETGTGKGELAKKLGREVPFVHVNLSEFSKGTLESELFGHVKGSFTGADSDKEGLFKKADGGILFLDEIGTLSLELQKKLLRVIEEQSFYPVGSNKIVKSKFRLITASCDDIEGLIDGKQFREDFYYRISALKIEITPLRERTEDIKELIRTFNSKTHKKICFSKEAMNLLLHFPWYGNYRELLSFLGKQKGLSRGIINLCDIEDGLIKKKRMKNNIIDHEMKAHIKEKGLGDLVNLIEKEALLWAKEQTKGKLNESMRLLKISKSLFYRIQNGLVLHAKT